MPMGKNSARNPEYSAAEPFRALFADGVPILVYHKIGPLPPGVKMKSLYVDDRLFSWQMGNLKHCGFSTGRIGYFRNNPAGQSPRAVLTFDDGSRSVFRHAMPALAAEKFSAMQFLVAGSIGGRNEWDISDLGEAPDQLMDKVEIREWMDAGHEIGAHTVSHPRLTKIPASRAREEIFGSKCRLEDLFGVPVRHFCYPYGNWNRAVRDLVEEAGYESAVTLDHGVNSRSEDPFALKRIGVRHPSRNFRNFLTLIAVRFPMRFFFGQR